MEPFTHKKRISCIHTKDAQKITQKACKEGKKKKMKKRNGIFGRFLGFPSKQHTHVMCIEISSSVVFLEERLSVYPEEMKNNKLNHLTGSFPRL